MMTSLFIDSSFAQFPNNPIPKNYAEDIFTAQTTSQNILHDVRQPTSQFTYYTKFCYR